MGTSISTTRAAACTPIRRFAPTRSCSRPACSATRIPAASARWRRRRSSSERAARVLEFFQRAAQHLHGGLHAERDGGAEAGRRGLPVRRRQPLSAAVRQPQLGERHPRVRAAREGASVEYVPLTIPDLRIDAERLGTRCSTAGDRRAEPVRVSRAVEFLGRAAPARARRSRHTRRGWDVLLDAAAFVPTNRLDLSAVQARLRHDLVLQDVRLPDRSRVSARAGPTRSRSCNGRGSPAARSISRPCRDARTSSPPREAGFEDGTLQLSEHSRGRDRPAAPRAHRHRHDPHARALPDRLAARAAPRPAARQRPADGPDLRPGDDGHARRIGDDELLRSGRASARLPPHRRAGEPAAHLAPHRLLLQSRARAKRPKG